MNKKYFFIINTFLFLFILFLAPRFSYKIKNDNEIYKYVSTTKENNTFIDTFKNKYNEVLQIKYKSKFNRNLTIQFENEPPMTTFVQMDRGERNTNFDSNIHKKLNWSLYEIIKKDSSGSFFIMYIKIIVINVLLYYIYNYYIKSKNKKFLIIFLCLFLLLILFSFRFI